MEQWVKEMRSGIYDYQFDKKISYDQYVSLYINSACQLHRQLIRPLGILPERLIIVPDGILGYIPFEALLTDSVTTPDYPYLIKDKIISYNYSIALWLKMKNKKTKGSKLLAVAPQFGKAQNENQPIIAQRGGLFELAYNDDEANNICKITGGDKLIGQEATKYMFLQKIPPL